jgi:hypothetical protein
VRIDELCPRDRAACLRAESRNRFDDFDTQAADRDVRINRLLHGPTPLRADNGDPSTYLWAACFAPEDMPRIVRERHEGKWGFRWSPDSGSGEVYSRGETRGKDWLPNHRAAIAAVEKAADHFRRTVRAVTVIIVKK